MSEQDNSSNSKPQTPAFSLQQKGRLSTRIADWIAQYTIIVGGIGVIVAVMGIMVFLVWVVVPLFRGAEIGQPTAIALETPTTQPATQPAAPAARTLAIDVDEDLATTWALRSDGRLTTFKTRTGERVRDEMLSDVPITAVSYARSDLAIGRADGTVRVGQVRSVQEFVDPAAVPDALEQLEPGATMTHDEGVATMTPERQIRVVRTTAEMSEPLRVGDGASPITLVDFFANDQLEVVVAMRADGRLFYQQITKRANMMTGEVKRVPRAVELPTDPALHGQTPATLLLGLNGRQVYVIYPDGQLLRFNTDKFDDMYLAERVDVLPTEGATLSRARLLLGDVTLIIADDTGGVAGWFAAPFPAGTEATTRDWLHMVRAHALASQPAAITAVASSSRDRSFVTADAQGNLWLRHMTSQSVQGTIELADASQIQAIRIAPKTDAIVAMDGADKLHLVRISSPHADASTSALFGKIHYEGYAEPEYIYQSSAGTDDAEPKYSMVPLIFGTIKATLYAMLFAVPVAVLAAIYTSEFMHRKLRATVKPVIELMASLPSVVLGFIGALVLAPYVESVVPAVLIAFAVVPLTVILFGFAWQILPPAVTLRVPGWVQFLFMIGTVGLAIVLAYRVGPWLEARYFEGDFKAWLGYPGWRIGSATPGWAILLAPLVAIGLAFAYNRYARPHLPAFVRSSRGVAAAFDLVRFIVLGLAAIAVATGVGWGLSSAGLDLRGSVVDTYVQRNSLIVGMIMGFAIVPIIYTISEDALSSVPALLRSAALGAGATRWQTAVRVVLPVATSGIFSACMIGLGRAVGETMIVLMVAGNTPLMDLNIFNGLRALSANIAVELPEAPVNSTHYRLLFLSGLLLFAMTFVLNTAAELIRSRFRKRAAQL